MKLIKGCFIIWQSLFQFGFSWKDEWIKRFEEKAVAQEKYCRSINYTQECSDVIPMFRPAQTQPSFYQIIPRAIWQTWKSARAAGPEHHRSMLSFLDQNPEYDYYLFDDDAALSFMCTFYPELALIYQQVVPNAVKADLWRLAVMFRYGGVYVDTDCRSIVPMHTIIWPNSSVVTGIGPLGDFHQWALLYAPRHVIVKSALKYASYNLKRLYNNQNGGDMTDVTGPGALHAAVRDTFQAHQCSSYTRSAVQEMYPHDAPIFLQQPQPCTKKMGVIQVYNGDYLGNRIIFKNHGADDEKNAVSPHYSSLAHDHQSLFRHVETVTASSSTVKIGACAIDRTDSKHRWKRNTRSHALA